MTPPKRSLKRARLTRPRPDYDPCFMPLGFGTSCCLPGTHTGGCLPEPAGYPPVVTSAVA